MPTDFNYGEHRGTVDTYFKSGDQETFELQRQSDVHFPLASSEMTDPNAIVDHIV